MTLIAPSMLSADFLHLEKDAEFVNAEADLFHLDIMDGSFVPNISYGFPVVEALAGIARKPMDAHLMIVSPEKYVRRFAEAGVRMLSIHYEAAGGRTGEIIDLIRSCGMKAGVAVNPDIPAEKLFPYVGKADFFLIMSVFAGFGGQKFMENSYERIASLREAVDKEGRHCDDTERWFTEDCGCLVEVDGGVSPANAGRLARAGADILVAGSSVFRAEDPAAAVRAMRSAI